MSYLTPSSGAAISLELLYAAAEIAHLELPPEDVPALATSFADHLAGIAILDRVDLTDFNPSLEFDPRWHD